MAVPAQCAAPAMEHYAGEVERIIFRNDENDWSVIRVADRDSKSTHVLVGYSGCQPGQVIEADGQWRTNGSYGRQFVAERVVALTPSTPHGLASYIGSGVLPGIGAKIAQQLVCRFGMGLVDVLDTQPDRLREIKGIGPAKVARIINGWKAQRAVREIMLFLHSQNISAALCRRIHKAFGDSAVEVIKTNPYRLCLDVRGVGFKTADAIGMSLAIPPASAQRVRSGMVHEMHELTGAGHCGCERDKFVNKAADMLNVSAQRVTEVLDDMLAEDATYREFVEYDACVYPTGLAKAEQTIAAGLHACLAHPPAHASRVDDALIVWAAKQCGMTLADKQYQAVKMGLTHKAGVITGGPGCGKTATLNVLLTAFRRLRLSVALVAPTGKAAQRAREATGIDAKTVHRLLGIRGMDDTDESQIHADVLVIDETSMVDVPLMARVVKALRDKTTVIMVGDVDQLPSVGPGQVLADIIHSDAVPVVVLDEVFRQAAGSAIITNAHAINRGQAPASAGCDGDFFVLTERNTGSIREAVRCDDEHAPQAIAEAVAGQIQALVATRLPGAYQFDPIRDIQVLAPMNKGGCGVIELNRRLQQALNPDPAQYINRSGTRFGIGDKVIQKRNNYALDIYNGDIGLIAGIGGDDEVLKVRFDGRMVDIPFDDLSDLALAYAMTIHKSQGSQSPVIVIPMVTQHWTMLQRNLLYTGVTRASQMAVVVGQTRAINAAVRTVSSSRRVTRLKHLLRTPAAEG